MFVAWRTDPEHRARCPLQVWEPADGAAGELRPADGADEAGAVTAERLRERVGWDVALRGILEAMHGDERAESAQALARVWRVCS